MKVGTKKVLDAVLRLPESDQLEVAEQLMAALDRVPEHRADATWAEELDRRSLEIASGKVKGLTWAQVKKGPFGRPSAKS